MQKLQKNKINRKTKPSVRLEGKAPGLLKGISQDFPVTASDQTAGLPTKSKIG